MQQLNFQGDHYSIGRTFGTELKRNSLCLLDMIPFELDEQRSQFIKTCLPVYQQYFPEILAEIQGIADGQEISVQPLQAALFGMYCLMPGSHCSSFIVKNRQGCFLGRNSDFLTFTEEQCLNTSYTFTANEGFNFLGNTTAFVEMEDGINQHGLSIALTSVAPYKVQAGLNVGMLLRLVLEKCRTVHEAAKLISEIPHAGSGTLVIGDAYAEGILVELSPNQTAIYSLDEAESYLIATNMFNTPGMIKHNRLPEDTWRAEERYETMRKYLKEYAAEVDIKKAQQLLAGDYGFMCDYDRSTGKDTVWSCVYDLDSSQVYRAAGNPANSPFKKDVWPKQRD
ncbi:C45 family autoproteolytic acyltransferase/hydolase [Enterococcus sp. AZ163]|uniref:C45 family autoproteolytic acyltransferase/hydolase n=1 Tax=Enterococcus sp. AZ163 TaxID=2774638 RepID=UPI003D2A73EC